MTAKAKGVQTRVAAGWGQNRTDVKGEKIKARSAKEKAELTGAIVISRVAQRGVWREIGHAMRLALINVHAGVLNTRTTRSLPAGWGTELHAMYAPQVSMAEAVKSTLSEEEPNVGEVTRVERREPRVADVQLMRREVMRFQSQVATTLQRGPNNGNGSGVVVAGCRLALMHRSSRLLGADSRAPDWLFGMLYVAADRTPVVQRGPTCAGQSICVCANTFERKGRYNQFAVVGVAAERSRPRESQKGCKQRAQVQSSSHRRAAHLGNLEMKP
ncbi:hypothetical protein BDV95DRAFT_596370 [Massariosphaeria phaeospora]|uniref:Uncharacterized protein n=1 Tax=Massariosphaeria phaeospora TaxID=100035 RepID=A0A7C8I6F5_9PLEO|nr:hypothetical protein BDV95DRAFT_596370 [Massariosphaeria phaeospora]